MRLTKKAVERRCRFVTNLHMKNHELTSTEIGNQVKARFGQEMHPTMIKRVRAQAEAERLAKLNGKASAAEATAALPPPPPVAVVEPKLEAQPSTEMVEGLKLLKQAIFKAAQAGTVKIVATKDGKINVSYELETHSANAFEL